MFVMKPNICKECGFSSAYHTILVEETVDATKQPGDVLNKDMGNKAVGNNVLTTKPVDEAKEDEKEMMNRPGKYVSH